MRLLSLLLRLIICLPDTTGHAQCQKMRAPAENTLIWTPKLLEANFSSCVSWTQLAALYKLESQGWREEHNTGRSGLQLLCTQTEELWGRFWLFGSLLSRANRTELIWADPARHLFSAVSVWMTASDGQLCVFTLDECKIISQLDRYDLIFVWLSVFMQTSRLRAKTMDFIFSHH